MNTDNLSFEIVPRFYVTCLYVNSKITKSMEKDFIENFKEVGFEIETISIHKIASFDYLNFTRLGYLKIEVKPQKLPSPEPSKLAKVSQAIETLCKKYNSEEVNSIKFDIENQPYAINIAVKVSGLGEKESDEVMWTDDVISRYKKSIGKWIEFYSGHWPDYSEELYLSRIKNNLSNRLSELHFIRKNSSFIYMPHSGYDAYMPYMNKFFIEQILYVRSLLLCYSLLNKEVDEVNRRFTDLKKRPIKEIEKEIEKVETLERSVQNLASHTFKERFQYRRYHSSRVLETCYNLFQIEAISPQVEEKINKLQAALVSERTVQQQKLAQQQRIWISILTVLLGSQVAFEVKDRMITFLNIASDEPIVELIEVGLWVIMGIAVSVAIVGLVYSWFSKRYKIGK